MSKLNNLLEKQKARIILGLELGEEGATKESITGLKDDFVRKIQIISRQNRVFLWINVVMVLLIFLASVWLVYHFIDKPNNLAVIFGASGVTIGGMIYYMTYLWRQVTGIEITIAMVDRLPPTALPSIIDSLLSTIKRQPAS